MKLPLTLLLFALSVPVLAVPANAQTIPDDAISPARPVATGKAPGMEAKLLKDTPEEQVYAIVFHKGDEVLSGLTDFAIAHKITDAHFTAIGATTGATLAWLDLAHKNYH